MPDKLLIYSAGGNGRETLMTAEAVNAKEKRWDILGFIDDDPSLWKTELDGYPVLGGKDVIADYPGAKIVAVMGSPESYAKRAAIIDGLKIPDDRWATIVHPGVQVAKNAFVGKNVIVMSGGFISCDTSVGDHCVILPNVVISHHSQVGPYSCIGSNVSISGRVTVGRGCYIGSGVSIKNDIKILDGSLIGIGSTVLHDVESHTVVAGNPAKALRSVTH